MQGNAESLPFPDESFDAVINVEASHAYPHFDRFLPELTRVLRPRGHFLYADFRGFLEFDDWDAALAALPMQMVSKRRSTRRFCAGWTRTRRGTGTWSLTMCPGSCGPSAACSPVCPAR